MKRVKPLLMYNFVTDMIGELYVEYDTLLIDLSPSLDPGFGDAIYFSSLNRHEWVQIGVL